MYVKYEEGHFPFGAGLPVSFDEFVDYVKGDECFDLWGEDDDAEAARRPLPCARGAAAKSARTRRQLFHG